ncbi:MAG: hypothetical protein ACK53Y_04865, partial [bacterium]
MACSTGEPICESTKLGSDGINGYVSIDCSDVSGLPKGLFDLTDSSGANHMQEEPCDAFHRVPAAIPVGSILSNEHPCSYLPVRTANLPLILPANVLSLTAMDAALASGMRRAGLCLYYTQCQGC